MVCALVALLLWAFVFRCGDFWSEFVVGLCLCCVSSGCLDLFLVLGAFECVVCCLGLLVFVCGRLVSVVCACVVSLCMPVPLGVCSNISWRLGSCLSG